MNTNEFESKLQKGTFAEDIVADWFVLMNYHVYRIYNQEESHPFDMIVLYLPENQLRLCDVKCKGRLETKDATGIDYKFYVQYKKWSELYHSEFELIFVDGLDGKIYSANINHLDRYGNPFRLEGNIYWHLECMAVLRDLTKAEIEVLRKINYRNPSHDGVEPKELYHSYFRKRYWELKTI